MSFKQSTAFFIGSMVFVSGICAGVNYLYTCKQEVHSVLASKKSVKLFYSILLLINLLGAVLVLSDNLLIKNTLQQELVDFFIAILLFPIWTRFADFFTLEKIHARFSCYARQKKDSVGDYFSNTYFLKKSNDHCLTSDLYWTGFVFCSLSCPKFG